MKSILSPWPFFIGPVLMLGGSITTSLTSEAGSILAAHNQKTFFDYHFVTWLLLQFQFWVWYDTYAFFGRIMGRWQPEVPVMWKDRNGQAYFSQINRQSKHQRWKKLPNLRIVKASWDLKVLRALRLHELFSGFVHCLSCFFRTKI